MRRIYRALSDRSRQFHVVGAGGYHAASAEAFHYVQLRQYVFAAMLRRQLLPEIEATGIAQLGTVEQYATTNPGHPVIARLVATEAQLLLHMEQIGGVMQMMPSPGRTARHHLLRRNALLPEFDLLLRWPPVVAIAQPMQG